MADEKPHSAQILLQIEVMEVLEDGQTSGRPINLELCNIHPKEKIVIKGFDKFELLRKLKQKLEDFRK